MPTAALTAIAMVAFAANSVLCRLALGSAAIDAYSFTAIRIGAGAVALLLIMSWKSRPKQEAAPSWRGSFYLLLYALPFSLAYLRIDTGTGALLLFGAVQLTMIGMGLWAGERPRLLEWLGFLGAASGVVYLISPGASAPDPVGAALMVLAGIGWGLYSVAGKGAREPVYLTSVNFLRAACIIIPATGLAHQVVSISLTGVLLAVVSGAIASGIGYAIWYAALTDLATTRAALVQLSVPVVAAVGGVVFIAEAITLRLVIASAVILGSIAVGTMSRR